MIVFKTSFHGTINGWIFFSLSHSLVAIPVYVRQNISFFETGSSGRLDITVGPKQTMGKTVECVGVTIHMPKVVLSANLTATQGTYTYDPVTKVQHWSDNTNRNRFFFKVSGLKKQIHVISFYLLYNLVMANFQQTSKNTVVKQRCLKHY